MEPFSTCEVIGSSDVVMDASRACSTVETGPDAVRRCVCHISLPPLKVLSINILALCLLQLYPYFPTSMVKSCSIDMRILILRSKIPRLFDASASFIITSDCPGARLMGPREMSLLCDDELERMWRSLRAKAAWYTDFTLRRIANSQPLPCFFFFFGCKITDVG